VATTMDKDPVSYPPDSLLTDSCDVYGNGSAAPSTYWVGAAGTAGHTIILTLPCTVTIDRQIVQHCRKTIARSGDIYLFLGVVSKDPKNQ
jgi:hypothetical protein